jgi:hypothetical protein
MNGNAEIGMGSAEWKPEQNKHGDWKRETLTLEL